MKESNQTYKPFGTAEKEQVLFVTADKIQEPIFSKKRIYIIRGLLFKKVPYSELIKSYSHYEIEMAYNLNREYLAKKLNLGGSILFKTD